MYYHGLDFFFQLLYLFDETPKYFKKYKGSKAQAVWHLIVN